MNGRPIINTRKITDFETILNQLTILNQQLLDTQLDRLVSFNQAYWVVTHIIREAMNQDYFANPKFLEAFSVCFAKYYFRAVNDLQNDSSKVIPAWQAIIDNRYRPTFISLLMGANAHINYDLPLALVDIMDGVKKAELLSDIIKVDKLLLKSGKEIINTFSERNRFYDFVRRHGRWLYFRPIMLMILFWRTVAWRNYRLVDNKDINIQYMAKRSTIIAKRLSRVSAILSRSVKL